MEGGWATVAGAMAATGWGEVEAGWVEGGWMVEVVAMTVGGGVTEAAALAAAGGGRVVGGWAMANAAMADAAMEGGWVKVGGVLWLPGCHLHSLPGTAEMVAVGTRCHCHRCCRSIPEVVALEGRRSDCHPPQASVAAGGALRRAEGAVHRHRCCQA